jgi:trehalose/maltose hydrolase-like predicted phosphorylase
VLDHHIELDIHRSVLTRRSRLRDADGRVVALTQRRFVSLADPHLSGLQTTLVAENWSGRLRVRSALDGTVRNGGVARYADLPSAHLTPLYTVQEDDEVVCLHVETNQSRVRVAQAARTRVWRDGVRLPLVPELVQREGYVALDLAVDVEQGQEVQVDKIASLFTSRDTGIGEPGEQACRLLMHTVEDFDALLDPHVLAWRQRWDRVRLELGTDGEIARTIHLHIFHLLQTVSRHSIGMDVGVPARGLHGEAYRGHIFWDELFILPFLAVRVPAIAREILLYRFRRLEEARFAAREAGFRGAMFPWQSASTGQEETQTMHLNPVSGRWLADGSHLQRHVGAAIAYNTWHYFQATHDLEFLSVYGAELILEIARFWASAATYSHALDRYEIKGVMGPDEYHERYPDAEHPGLDNNAYTNLMAVWCLCRAFDTLAVFPTTRAQALRERLGITGEELDHWRDVSTKMRVCFHDGVISQFEGYERLEELDWASYRERYGDISRLDRILESEDDTPNRYRLTKQADTAMLTYLLSDRELNELMHRLGYECDDDLIERTIEYYEQRTVHGSTLSRIVHAWINARRDRQLSWDFFVTALLSDLDDIQRGTTKEGIHLGAMASTVDLVQRGYSGLEMRGDVLYLDPAIPEELGSLAFPLHYRGNVIDLEITTRRVRLSVVGVDGGPVDVVVAGERHCLGPGATVEVALE